MAEPAASCRDPPWLTPGDQRQVIGSQRRSSPDPIQQEGDNTSAASPLPRPLPRQRYQKRTSLPFPELSTSLSRLPKFRVRFLALACLTTTRRRGCPANNKAEGGAMFGEQWLERVTTAKKEEASVVTGRSSTSGARQFMPAPHRPATKAPLARGLSRFGDERLWWLQACWPG